MFLPLDNALVVALIVVGCCLLFIVVCIIAAKRLGKVVLAESVGKTPPKKASFWGLVIFGVFWSAITLLADTTLGTSAWNQYRTLSFATTEGDVLSCAVEERPGDEGTTYHVDIEYAYEVHNQRYTSKRVRYLDAWGGNRVRQFVENHPAKTRITVYYDPEDPAEAVLAPGVGGNELFMALFMLPFNTVMAGFWLSGLVYLRCGGKAVHNWWNGVRISHDADSIRVRLPRIAPWLATSLVLFAAPIVFIFPVACCLGRSIPIMLGAWTLLLAIAGTVYLATAWPLFCGKADLVIDRYHQRLTLPQTYGRKEAVVVSRAELVAIDVVEKERKTSEGTDPVYVLTVRGRDARGELQAEKLAEWSDRDHAEELAGWIRDKVGLTPASRGVGLTKRHAEGVAK
jgi:hypothetical protein